MTSKGGTWGFEYGFLRPGGLSETDAWSREAVIRWALVMRCNLGTARYSVGPPGGVNCYFRLDCKQSSVVTTEVDFLQDAE